MKKAITSPDAPPAIGPYSQSIAAGNMLFISGQIAIDPATGKELIGDIAEKTRRILINIGTLLKEAGASYEDIVKTTVFLKDLGEFAEMNRAYGEFFKEIPPARSAVQVAALPLNASIEIEVIATLG